MLQSYVILALTNQINTQTIDTKHAHLFVQ